MKLFLGFFFIFGVYFTDSVADDSKIVRACAQSVSSLKNSSDLATIHTLAKLMELAFGEAKNNQMYPGYIIESERFRAFLSKNKLDWYGLPASDKNSVVVAYANDLLASYPESGGVTRKRNQSLFIELTHRGAKHSVGEKDGYDLLTTISKKNVLAQKEFLEKTFGNKSKMKETPRDIVIEIKGLVTKLQFHYVHNTYLRGKAHINSPLLSSRILNEAGLPRMLNTNPFNKDFLKSDNNIFFFVVPRMKTLSEPFVVSHHGPANLVLDTDYATSFGWISPFVMYERELVDLAEERMNVKSVEGKKLDRKLVSELSKFDFNPSDMEEFMKLGFSMALEDLFHRDRSEYQNAVEDLLTDRDAAKELVQKLVWTPLGFNYGLELKIPISVSPEVLRVYVDRTQSRDDSFDQFNYLNPLGGFAPPGFNKFQTGY